MVSCMLLCMATLAVYGHSRSAHDREALAALTRRLLSHLFGIAAVTAKPDSAHRCAGAQAIAGTAPRVSSSFARDEHPGAVEVPHDQFYALR